MFVFIAFLNYYTARIGVLVSNILTLFLIFRAKMFSLLPLSVMLELSFLLVTFIRLRKFLSIPSLPKDFFREWVLNFVKCLFFLRPLKQSCGFSVLDC